MSLALAACGDGSESVGSLLAGRSGYGSPEEGVAGSWGDVAAGSAVATSEWGRAAVLVLVATIGGPNEDRPEYLFSSVKSMAIGTAGVYVLDGGNANQKVHAFDFQGTYTGSVGRQGEGPGEYGRPRVIATDLAGHLWVRDAMSFLEFDANGSYVQSRPTDTRSTAVDAFGFAVTGDQAVLIPAIKERLGPSPLQSTWSIVTYPPGSTAPTTARDVPHLEFEERLVWIRVNERNTVYIDAPFFPKVHWAVAPSGTIAIGIANSALIELHPVGASQPVRIELRGHATAIVDGEGRWHRDRIAAVAKRGIGASGWRPATDALPPHKPFFEGIGVDDQDRFWVIRAGRGKRWPTCNESAVTAREFWAAPCWQDTYSMEAFAADGRYLGSVPLPVGAQVRPHPVVRQDLVLVHVKGRDGNSALHLYRLTGATPGPSGQEPQPQPHGGRLELIPDVSYASANDRGRVSEEYPRWIAGPHVLRNGRLDASLVPPFLHEELEDSAKVGECTVTVYNAGPGRKRGRTLAERYRRAKVVLIGDVVAAQVGLMNEVVQTAYAIRVTEIVKNDPRWRKPSTVIVGHAAAILRVESGTICRVASSRSHPFIGRRVIVLVSYWWDDRQGVRFAGVPEEGFLFETDSGTYLPGLGEGVELPSWSYVWRQIRAAAKDDQR